MQILLLRRAHQLEYLRDIFLHNPLTVLKREHQILVRCPIYDLIFTTVELVVLEFYYFSMLESILHHYL